MLMTTPKDAMQQLRPISSALSREDFAFIERRALEISASLEWRRPQRYAEIYEGVTPHWHVVMVLPGQERTAAEDLSERRFGVYLPESEHVEIRRGRRREVMRLMIPGYVFVFVWDVDEHLDRIRACDGVRGLLFMNGQALIVPDAEINKVRVAENRERPLKGLSSEGHEPSKKPKRCWRKKRKSESSEDVNGQDNHIIGVHSWSPFLEELRNAKDDEQVGAFHRALAAALCLPAESA